METCLKFNGLVLEKWQIEKKFAISTNLIVHTVDKKDACFTFHHQKLNYEQSCKNKTPPLP